MDITFVAVTTSLSIMLAVFEVSCTAERAFLTSEATSLTREVTYGISQKLVSTSGKRNVQS